ncbi:MAG: type II CAAX endopeptidase family protein [Candidatus Promineifilaceae bacterium]|nr:CPBP family intramembrane metalloprotease [Anaerolineaceae bacterium]
MDIYTLVVAASLIVLANKIQQVKSDTFLKLFDLLLMSLNIPVFLLGILLVFRLANLGAVTDLPIENVVGVGFILQGTAVWGIVICFRSTRHSMERIMPVNPHSPVHTLALLYSGYFASTVILQLAGGLDSLAANLTEVSVGLFLVQQLSFVVLALLGVGVVIRRDWTAVLQRLGLGPLTGRQLIESVGWVALLVLLQAVGGAIWAATNPDEVALIEQISQTLYQNFGLWHWLALAIGAGIGEEILFRGALQPAQGIWFTSALFAIVHVQYGLFTPATVVLFLLSFILGTIRQRHNTSMAILVHIGYDLALALITLWATAA